MYKGTSKLGDSIYSTYKSEYRSSARQEDNEDKEGSLIYLIRNCFKDLMAIEGGLETAKKELAIRPDFTLAGAFNLFTGYS